MLSKAVLMAGLILLISTEVWPCSGPKPGYGLDADELIQVAKDIYIVELQEISEDKYETRNSLQIVEAIKGEQRKIETFFTHSKHHFATDFLGHSDMNFWKVDSVR